MDDLNGLSWTSNSRNAQKPPPLGSEFSFPTVTRSNISGRSTPLSATGPSHPPSKSATPDNDSFANLVSFGSSNSNKKLSLLEQQKRLQEERVRKEAENRSKLESQYGGQNAQFWDNLEKVGSKNPFASTPRPVPQRPPSADEDDLLAAFDASAPVDASTNFPIPSPSPSPQIAQSASIPAAQLHQTGGMSFNEDDDPFGLNQLKPKPTVNPQPAKTDDDDFLGLLGKPVSEVPRPAPEPSPKPSSPVIHEDHAPSPKPSNGVDRAIAELVDMGFPADKASQALRATASGTDVQAAVSLLLTQAHEEARQKSRSRTPALDRDLDHQERSSERSSRQDRDVPSWMREEQSRSRASNRSPASTSKDPSQVAATFGNNFLKTANSLWKQGSKKVQQVVNELNSEHDQSQPRWLKEASARQESRPQPAASDHRASETSHRKSQVLTDEALLLEAGTGPRPARHQSRVSERPSSRTHSNGLRSQQSPAGEARTPQPAFMQQQLRSESLNPKSRVSKNLVEEQTAQAYVSPARRRRPAAQPSAPDANVNLFDSSAQAPPANRSRPTPPPAQSSKPSAPSKPLPVRAKAPPRVTPQLSQESLASTHRHREKGTEAYKRGDYAAAHESFTCALTMLPDKHPITIIIRSNRATTALKVGEPKVAISDADAILELIGPSKGEAETIDLANGEATKPMKDFYGKALMRKAEALEQLERWADAAQAWRQAVENGHGGSTSIQGRNRCEKAAGISKPAAQASAPAKRPPAPAPKKPSALDDLRGGSPSTGGSSEAVSRLRAANQAAERADEEKFALGESVDARINAWKGGKQDNLRALLASLDTVLWPEAGWKKVNMSELILPNKVKVQYMKGIAKVHPDKVC
jgi:tetratricopeptide (TPR) repeat protein